MTAEEKLSRDLSENSAVYAGQPELYETFAQAEDRPGCVQRFLSDHVRGKDVLELGCGTGKYVRLLSPLARTYRALEISFPMLQFARKKAANSAVSFHHGSAESLPFPDQTFDVVFASWVLGTILDDERRMKAVKEAKRVLREGGRIILIENDTGGEFEKIRGRWPDAARTQAYNSWLEKEAGFTRSAEFESFFEFPRLEEAKDIFGRIWGLAAQQKTLSRRIEHKIVVYSLSSRNC